MSVTQAESSKMELRIALLINSEALCTGLAALLPDHYDITVVKAPVKGVDLLITSAHHWQSLERAFEADDRRPKVLVIGDDLHSYDTRLFSALPSDGFLNISDLSAQRVTDTIQRVMAGEMPMPPQLARHLLSNPRPLATGPDERSAVLTPRERETLSLLVRGMSNKQVARALGISMHGAKRLVATILLKLGAPNRTAAVVIAMKSGLA